MIEAPRKNNQSIESIEERTQIGEPLMLALATAVHEDPLTRLAYENALSAYQSAHPDIKDKQNLHFSLETSTGVKLVGSFYLDYSVSHQRALISLMEKNNPAHKRIGFSIEEKDHVITNFTFHAGNLKDSHEAAQLFEATLSEFFGSSAANAT